MSFVVVSTLVCLVLAGLVLAYTAFPHRKEPTPGAPWLGQAVERAADAVPVIEDGELESDDDADTSSSDWAWSKRS